jgi:hypothetical protein
MPTSEDVKPAPFSHCEMVYLAMRNAAKDIYEGDVPMVVWEGFLTKLTRDLGLSVPYYSTVRGYLLEMGCMRQLRRGGGTTPSQWELIRPPTMELWKDLPDKPSGRLGNPTNTADPADVATLKQRVNDLEATVETLKANFGTFIDLYNKGLKKEKESA